MRLLVSLVGPGGGILVGEDRGSTRKSLAQIPHDAVHLLAVDPDDPEIERVQNLVERTGARFTVDPIEDEHLLDAFGTIVDVIEHHRNGHDEGDDPVDIHLQVNAGRHANLLSAAGLLACLHEGIPAHFVHEEGHDELGVLTRAPLGQLLDEDERAALTGFPGEGILLTEASQHDPGALNELKDRDLIERDGDRLVLTDRGEAYREHLRRG